MINPYYIYILTFLLSILVYQLGWSTLFPSLKLPVILFLITSITLSFFFGFYFQVKKYIEFKAITYNRIIPFIFYCITFLWLVSFIYNGGIPLLLILSGSDYDYTGFGIPTLHVFIVTFTSFFSTYLFHVYVSTKSKKVLIYFLFLMLFPILLFSRGMLMINITSALFVYLQAARKISLKKIVLISTFTLLVLYGFGVLGNIRLAPRDTEEYSNELIVSLAKATPEFTNGITPPEFMWAYLYISSPLGNLQYNIDRQNRLELSPKTVLLYFNNEFLFDFISKRINSVFEVKREHCLKFADFLTVGTTYANSYIYLGWAGMIIMGVFILLFPVVYLTVLKKHHVLFVTGTSILSSLYLFLIFDNMFAFTGLSFQLVYPLIFGFLFKSRKQNIKDNFSNHKR